MKFFNGVINSLIIIICSFLIIKASYMCVMCFRNIHEITASEQMYVLLVISIWMTVLFVGVPVSILITNTNARNENRAGQSITLTRAMPDSYYASKWEENAGKWQNLYMKMKGIARELLAENGNLINLAAQYKSLSLRKSEIAYRSGRILSSNISKSLTRRKRIKFKTVETSTARDYLRAICQELVNKSQI